MKLMELAEAKGFKSVIVAELVEDKSDSMTDYFATGAVGLPMILGFSTHNRDLFPEMRKAADTFEETKHLGVGKDRYTLSIVALNAATDPHAFVYRGDRSRWHSDLLSWDEQHKVYSTEAEAQAVIDTKGVPHTITFGETVVEFKWEIRRESIEHKEKYSMGHGYYLKASSRYSSGWEVSKSYFDGAQRAFEADRLTDHARKQLGLLEVKELKEAVVESNDKTSEPKPEGTVTHWRRNPDHKGIEVEFADKPSPEVRQRLKDAKFKWHRVARIWYAKETPQTLATAQAVAPKREFVEFAESALAEFLPEVSA